MRLGDEGCLGSERVRLIPGSQSIPPGLSLTDQALPALLKEAEDRGDLYATTNVRTRLSYLVKLAGDEPDSAREELRDAIAIWPADSTVPAIASSTSRPTS